jgi:hypothetical protein
MSSGDSNVAIGYEAGRYRGSGNLSISTANTSIFIGHKARSSSTDNQSNQIVIGANAVGLGTNTTVIGTSATTATRLRGVLSTGETAPTIASAATIAPTKQITFISGTTAISTITAPTGISTTGGQITLIPTGAWSTGTSGNIALATTAVVNKALIMTYDATTTKWYPSY